MIELNTIYNEDCMEGMKRIPDGSVDCIICDLPYGTTRNAWGSVIPLDELWVQYKRIIKERGAIVLFSQMPFTSVLAMSNLEMLKYEWIWEKPLATGFLNSKYAPLKAHENILVFSKSAACFVKDSDDAMVYNPQMRTGKPYSTYSSRNAKSSNYNSDNIKSCKTVNDGSDYYPRDVISFGSDKTKFHPTQKPVSLLKYLVLTYSNKGDTILDNCMGSGTTALACIDTGRNFIGFEKEKKYFDIAMQRIAQMKQQPKLDF